MKPWNLIDSRDPVDAPEDFPKVAIQSESHLRAELDRFRQRDPTILGLEGPLDQGLQIGLGGPYAGIRWSEYPRSNRTGTALADRIHCENRIDFMSEGDFLSFWPEALMPVERAIEVIVSFYKNLRVPDWIGWKEWDPVLRKWNVKPAAKAPSAMAEQPMI